MENLLKYPYQNKIGRNDCRHKFLLKPILKRNRDFYQFEKKKIIMWLYFLFYFIEPLDNQEVKKLDDFELF